MTDIDNFGTSWQGLTHGQVEDAIKAKVAHLDNTKLEESSDVIQQLVSAVTSAYYMRPTGIPKTDLAGDVQTSLGKADTALQQADKTQLQNAINSLQSSLDTLTVVDLDGTTLVIDVIR